MTSPQSVNENQPNAKRALLLVTQADWGGVQSFLVNFAAGLREQGWEVLLAAGGTGELFARAAEKHVATEQLTQVRREIDPLHDLRAVLQIRRLLKKFKPNAVHLNSTKMGILGSLAALGLKPRPRIVYRIGGWVFLEPLPTWKKWFYLQTEKFTAHFKDEIICVHPGDAELAARLGIKPRGKIRVVPNGLPERFEDNLLSRVAARAELGLSADALVFGTVANAYATKGLLPYLDALKPLHDESPTSNFVIVGDGPQLEELKQKKERLGLNRLILTGHRDDANRLYRAFDIFVLPSVKEGMPWTLLEAMAAGLPIVATDVGANDWMTHDDVNGTAALIVPAHAADSLLQAMRELSTQPDERQKMGAAGQNIVKNRFRWEHTFSGNATGLEKNGSPTTNLGTII
ncbi:MAG: glycosyltransferase family 4 protein [Patescibacteria group bacterium]